MRRESKTENRHPMFLRTVPFMFCKAIPRRELVKRFHIAIAGNLGHNRGRSNRQNRPVTSHNGDLMDIQIRNPVTSVNRDAETRVLPQRSGEKKKCPGHGQKGCPAHIFLVDLINCRPPQGDMSGLLVDQTGKKGPPVRREAL